MCENCKEPDDKIARYRRFLACPLDSLTTARIKLLVDELEQTRNSTPCPNVQSEPPTSAIYRGSFLMPRYYFDVRDGDVISADDEGFELPNIEAAHNEAALSLAEMAKDRIKGRAEHGEPNRMAVEVRNETGPIFKAKLTFQVEP